jgi:hypothetical protein
VVTGQDGEVAETLIGIATEAIDAPRAAGERLADWIGREPSRAGELKMQQLAHLGPRLVADALLRGGWAQPDDAYAPSRTDIPAAQLAAVRAVARHLAWRGRHRRRARRRLHRPARPARPVGHRRRRAAAAVRRTARPAHRHRSSRRDLR